MLDNQRCQQIICKLVPLNKRIIYERITINKRIKINETIKINEIIKINERITIIERMTINEQIPELSPRSTDCESENISVLTTN